MPSGRLWSAWSVRNPDTAWAPPRMPGATEGSRKGQGQIVVSAPPVGSRSEQPLPPVRPAEARRGLPGERGPCRLHPPHFSKSSKHHSDGGALRGRGRDGSGRAWDPGPGVLQGWEGQSVGPLDLGSCRDERGRAWVPWTWGPARRGLCRVRQGSHILSTRRAQGLSRGWEWP